jgi:hypothetical protein
MHVDILNECGYNESAIGFSLSYNITVERAKELLPKYAFGKPGENKFLESMSIWIDVTAPRFWFQEFDTYRVGISKQSSSTMHTIMKKRIDNDDFEYPIPEEYLQKLNDVREDYLHTSVALNLLKGMLPEGFLQRRIVSMNYKCLQNMYNQRKDHKLPQWHMFLDTVLKEIEHPEFIIKE